MNRTLLLLLTLSLAANAWLVLLAKRNRDNRAPIPVDRVGRATSDDPAPILSLLNQSKTGGASDLAALRDRLRESGIGETSIRAVLEGVLHNSYREQLAAESIDEIESGWWRGLSLSPVTGTLSPAAGGRAEYLRRTQVTEPLRTLLGRDPLQVADAERNYDFLPPDKRRLLAEIDLDYNELQLLLNESRDNGAILASTRSEVEARTLLQVERRNDVLAALSPAERAEYELRFTGAAIGSENRFAVMEATLTEYRSIKAILDRPWEVPEQGTRVEQAAARRQNEQAMINEIVAAIGYDRTVDFLWAANGSGGNYAEVVRALRTEGLPVANAAKFLQLAAETGNRAEAIHFDATLTAEQKRTALWELQQAIGPTYFNLITPTIQQELPDRIASWYTQLGEGKYVQFNASASSSGTGSYGVRDVTAEPTGAPRSPPLARKPDQ